jgi:hypothetical protein
MKADCGITFALYSPVFLDPLIKLSIAGGENKQLRRLYIKMRRRLKMKQQP